MDTENQRSVSKGPIFDAVNSASSIANMRLTALGFGFFGMASSCEIRTSFAKQSQSLLLFGFLRCNFTKPGLSKFFSSFFCPDVSPVLRQNVSMAIGQMFCGGKAFEIIYSVVSFITVNVVNMSSWVEIIQPTCCDNTVHKALSPQRQITILSRFWGKGDVLSKNFSAPRDGIKMVECSIFDSIYGKANHGEPLGCYG